MKKLLLSVCLVGAMLVAFAQKPYKVVFYNLENLFDTINDPNKNDEEYLPEGARKWTTYRYNCKLDNMSRVLFDIAAEDKNFPAVIGVSEIESRSGFSFYRNLDASIADEVKSQCNFDEWKF